MRIYAARAGQAEERSEALLDLLDSTRREKVHRIKNKAERSRSIYAGLLLRYAFLREGYCIQEWERAQVTLGLYGKPALAGYDAFCYSLSHSGEWVVCAVDTEDIGVDIQQMRPYHPALAQRFYHETEFRYLSGLSAEEQRRHFYQMWAAKESYAKLTGRGIGAGVSDYLTRKITGQIVNQKTGQAAFIKIYSEIAEHVLCVCSYREDFPVRIDRVSEADLTGSGVAYKEDAADGKWEKNS